MKKQNAEFITAFTSEANTNLKNTDSFAYVELDDYACYVIADGIDDKVDAKSARLCVDSIITVFTEAPSMSKGAMKKYIHIANQTLLETKSKKRLKSSITIIVHNYVKMRYAQAGNTRFRLYRNGFLKEQSIDQSLSMDMVLDEKIPKDMLQKHGERNNLYTYAGQKNEFLPFISKKIKLTNSDAISLYTRGFWEYVDEGELLDIFTDASDKPEDTVNTAEDVLLSKQPKELEKYTFVTIFVNKIFTDPNKKRRIKRIIMATIPILTTIIIIGVILGVKYKKRQESIALMNEKFLATVEYIMADNYIRAEKTCNEARTLAEKVKDKEMKKEAGNYLMLVESVVKADESFGSYNYKEAQAGYLNALDRSRFADKLADGYLEDKLELTANYISIYDFIALGDTLALNSQYNEAEEKYLEAKAIATKTYFDKGRIAAISALDNLYKDKKEAEEKDKEQENKNKEQENKTITETAVATNLIAQGDKLFTTQDYESALVFYLSAKQKYEELKDTKNTQVVDEKIKSTQIKMDQVEEKRNKADVYMNKAEDYSVKADVVEAKKYYLLAKDIYARLKDDEKVAEIMNKIEMLEVIDN